MPHAPPADALVLCLSAGVTLRDWQTTGLLEREWALYHRLSRVYPRLVVVTGGGDEEAALARSLPLHPACTLSVAGPGPAAPDPLAAAAARCLEALGGCASAIVKTNQHSAGPAALASTAALRAGGLRTALIARAGYGWSLLLARERGPESAESRDAARQEADLIGAADLLVATTPALIDSYCWRYQVPLERCAVIPNYVLTELPPRFAHERDGAAAGSPFSVLYAGRLSAEKRVGLLMEAVGLLPPDLRARAVLRIVGEGPLEARLRTQAAASSLRVEFTPRVPHARLLELMRSCTLYAQVSAHEGHPKTVLEAMAAGAPVLVTRAPGLGEVVTHETSGLCTPEKPADIAAGLARLLADPALRDRLGRAAAASVRDALGLDRIVELEVEGHRRALVVASTPRPAPRNTAVRWDPSLPEQSHPTAVAAWEASLRGFCRRLGPEARARFLLAIDDPIYQMQGEAAVAAEGGLHPKHRLTRYHDFFVARLGPQDRVLDLGCGVGALAASIATRAGAHVTGVDLCPVRLAAARERAASAGLAAALEFRQGDITRDRQPGRFTAIVLSNVLEHLEHRPQVVRTWCDWYRPARLLIRVPALDRDWRAPYKRELGLEWRLDPTHHTEYTADQLEGELREAGLALTETVARWGEYWCVAVPR